MAVDGASNPPTQRFAPVEQPDLLDLLRAIEEATAPTAGGDPGASVAEMCQASGLHRDTVRGRLRGLIAAGLIKPGWGYRTAIHGVTQRIPVYSLTGGGGGSGGGSGGLS